MEPEIFACICGEVLTKPTIVVSIHSIRETTIHSTFECACGAEPPSYQQDTFAKKGEWEGVTEQLHEAIQVGQKIGKDGDYYKPGAFGFSWHDGEVLAIIVAVEGQEPEVEPICDGFGNLAVEVVIE